MKTMNYRDFEQEIIRAYTVLGAEKGSLQNDTDIEAWFKDGYINADEKNRLHGFNQRLYKRNRH